jgi:predicted AAA+ superfamily ATPase
LKRLISNDLKVWQNSKDRKPLLLLGARQVGKTWIMRDFGKNNYKNVAYFSLDDSSFDWGKIFSNITNPQEILLNLSALSGQIIKPGETLLILDEVQDHPDALNSLKYFAEFMPDLHIITAGSTLGVVLHRHQGFPVGKVDFKTVYPLSLLEFIEALQGETMKNLITWGNLINGVPLHNKLIQFVAWYYYLGGMPEVVESFRKQHDWQEAADIQNQLIQSYINDFSKYTKTADQAEKLRMLWNSVPGQLSKENNKFIYGAIKKGARAKDFESSIQWLKDSSLITKVNRVSSPSYSLPFYENYDAFKLFLRDTGIFARMSKLSSSLIVDTNRLLREFRGALSEQFVSQELSTNGVDPIYYWSNQNSKSEIDFLSQDYDGNVVPIEVKSGLNLRAKSLKAYQDKFNPKYSIRLSEADFKIDKANKIVDLPLYAISLIPQILQGDIRICDIIHA